METKPKASFTGRIKYTGRLRWYNGVLQQEVLTRKFIVNETKPSWKEYSITYDTAWVDVPEIDEPNRG